MFELMFMVTVLDLLLDVHWRSTMLDNKNNTHLSIISLFFLQFKKILALATSASFGWHFKWVLLFCCISNGLLDKNSIRM
jgi:hypothetical protein